MNISRIIFHIDMNAFFASCEIAENRELLNKPVIIAHSDALRKSIILTANYEARKYGIKTTMMVREAIKLCPEVTVIEPNMELYNHYSKLFFDYLKTITPYIEAGSIDEAYLDVSNLIKQFDIVQLAYKIQKDLYSQYLLPCSIGIGPNKFLAKMASDMKKPLGVTILRRREIDRYLWPLPIERMYGVGKKTAPRLQELGINTIGDLAVFKDIEILQNTVGQNNAISLQERANGFDNSIVDYTMNEVTSMSTSHTFDHDISDELIIKKTIKVLVNTLSHRLEEKSLKAQTIGLQIKYSDYKQFNRSRQIEQPTNDSKEIYFICEDLFEEFYDFKTDLRLVGVFATRLTEDYEDIKQYSIFDIDELNKENEIHKLLNEIKDTYGKNTISKGFRKK